ncbi:unnamed protein product [Prorocentrum cordatum]|uniref:SMI1/KNR4 family protein n=1 Tax=Prorocentrum cordatum TaxID=2364126 RepID=A0ABN9U7G1_9DINO|nr:unnamed protein product [Polarella glacialis]
MLAAAGFERDPMADLGTEEERALGRLVLEKYGSDLFFLDRHGGGSFFCEAFLHDAVQGPAGVFEFL